MNMHIFIFDITLVFTLRGGGKTWTIETSITSPEEIGLTQKYIDLFQPNGMIKFWHR